MTVNLNVHECTIPTPTFPLRDPRTMTESPIHNKVLNQWNRRMKVKIKRIEGRKELNMFGRMRKVPDPGTVRIKNFYRLSKNRVEIF